MVVSFANGSPSLGEVLTAMVILTLSWLNCHFYFTQSRLERQFRDGWTWHYITMRVGYMAFASLLAAQCIRLAWFESTAFTMTGASIAYFFATRSLRKIEMQEVAVLNKSQEHSTKTFVVSACEVR